MATNDGRLEERTGQRSPGDGVEEAGPEGLEESQAIETKEDQTGVGVGDLE